jgi:hypothetical protein
MLRPQIGRKSFALRKILNRVLEVTDKGKNAWQKRTIRCKEASLKSVCRELSRVALAAKTGPVYRLRKESLRAGVQLSRSRRG